MLGAAVAAACTAELLEKRKKGGLSPCLKLIF
jgi:hypothetical protein